MAEDGMAGKGIPHVGKQPTPRNADGTWRKKRSGAGQPRPHKEKWGKDPPQLSSGRGCPAASRDLGVGGRGGRLAPSPTAPPLYSPRPAAQAGGRSR